MAADTSGVLETVGEALMEAMTDAMVHMWESLRHKDCRAETEKPRTAEPIRIGKRIGVIVGIGIRIFRRWRWNHIDLRRQTLRILRDPPASVGLLA